mmetsp:Transcript_27395/g.48519  ORF Transcript_27395/g.48519 Transcript_27395/m.48519 type:complete len:586 (-) Transcript_27395:602-2359(-)
MSSKMLSLSSVSGSLPAGPAEINSSFDDQSIDAAEDSESYYSSCNGGGSSSMSFISPAQFWQEPIVVGYAFGPKKMSTMGVVMAEASRVQVIHEEPEEDQEPEGVEEVEVEDDPFCREVGNSAGTSWNRRNNRSELSRHGASSLTSAALQGLDLNNTSNNRISNTAQADIMATSSPLESTIITLGNSNDSDLRHIVRYFRSNCSSVACSSVAGSLASLSETSASTTPTTSANNSAGPLTCSNCKHQRRRGIRFPIRISFVPLDLDNPIEDQHGGNFDLILHKLTEDILSCSLQENSNVEGEDDDINNRQDPSWKRVHALQDYYQRNSHCCLVDHPKNVQTVMSRSDIANVLQKCLKSVTTTSGIPVKSPRFVVIPEDNDPQQRAHQLKRSLHENQEMSTPLIVKPLIAAGTKQSHFMLIAMQESAFVKLPSKSIVQEFVNHDATLFKVYVMGDYVSVYERHSLPNLPDDLSPLSVDLVDFDSQRPYPKLKDFGLDIETINDSSISSASDHVPVTVEEVRPVVDALKAAFGLELFGFDILRRSDDSEWLVVDVNYFPSYKEVPNFPSLLARYLTQRVLEQRRRGRR